MPLDGERTAKQYGERRVGEHTVPWVGAIANECFVVAKECVCYGEGLGFHGLKVIFVIDGAASSLVGKGLA